MKNEDYRVIKVLNNNVILGRRNDQEEVILIGKGLGFGKKSDKLYPINEKKIEKIFCNFEGGQKEEYMRVIDSIDYRLVGIGQEIISLAKEQLGKLSIHVHVALTDHMGFALQRMKEGMVIHNPFLYEIKTLYKEEYEIGLQAKEMIKQRLRVDIPEDEVGFIALHLHSAKQHQDIRNTVKNTRLIQEALGVIGKAVGGPVDKDKVLFSRLINHLRQSITRVEKDRQVVNPLIDEIKIKLKPSYDIASKVAELIEGKSGVSVSDGEKGFMSIHIERLRTELDKEKSS